MRTVIVTIWAVATTILGSASALALSIYDRQRDWTRPVGRLWARCILMVSGVKIHVQGYHHVRHDYGFIFMANHQSMFDIIALLACLPIRFRWLAKKELFQIPLFGHALTKGGHVPIDRSDRKSAYQSLLDAAGRIATGASVIIFPEGSRSSDDRLNPFKPGGFYLALLAKRPIVPVAIYGTHQVLPKGSIRVKPGHVIVRISRPISTDRFERKTKHLLMAEVRSVIENELTRMKTNWTRL